MDSTISFECSPECLVATPFFESMWRERPANGVKEALCPLGAGPAACGQQDFPWIDRL